MNHDCLFCRIASGALPAHRIHEDDRVVAFLDLHPIRPGHTLVIPREHHVWFEDMPIDLATAVTTCAQSVARAMKRLYRVERVALFYTGVHVPHVHAHVVPMHHVHDVTSRAYMTADGEGYAMPPQLPADEMATIAARLSGLVAAQGGAD